MDCRRAALIEVFWNLPDTELRKLGHDLQAHHLNAMKSGKVVLLPTEIHKIVHDLTHLAGNAHTMRASAHNAIYNKITQLNKSALLKSRALYFCV